MKAAGKNQQANAGWAFVFIASVFAFGSKIPVNALDHDESGNAYGFNVDRRLRGRPRNEEKLKAIQASKDKINVLRFVGMRNANSPCPRLAEAEGALNNTARALQAEDATPLLHAKSHAHHTGSSRCLRLEYVPSPWESYWKANVGNIADFGRTWECGCSHLRASRAYIDTWLQTWAARNEHPLNANAVPWNKNVMSYHRVIDMCFPGGPIVTSEIPIEPLVGMLRHPHYHCFREAALSEKEYMLVTSLPEVTPQPRRSFLFDLGASTYTEGLGGASQGWFVETYARQGINFDRILAWEATVINPSKIYESVPDEVLANLTYFNVPADPAVDSKHNPLRFIKMITRPDDFVVVKIDIDNSHVESLFMQQILESERLHHLIDELYHEHHAAMTPLFWCCFFGSVGNATLPDSYNLFTRLRELGIRAHGWV
jgi:hypothetical protein